MLTTWEGIAGKDAHNTWDESLAKENRELGLKTIQSFLSSRKQLSCLYDTAIQDLNADHRPNVDYVITGENLLGERITLYIEVKTDYFKNNNEFPIELFRYLPVELTTAFRSLRRVNTDSSFYADAQKDITVLLAMPNIEKHLGLGLATISDVETHYTICAKIPTGKVYVVPTVKLQAYVSTNLKRLPLIPCHNSKYDSLSVSIDCTDIEAMAEFTQTCHSSSCCEKQC